MCIRWVVVSSFPPDDCMVYTNIPYFIFSTPEWISVLVIFMLPFSLPILPEICQIYWYFQRARFLFNSCHIVFLFQIHWFLTWAWFLYALPSSCFGFILLFFFYFTKTGLKLLDIRFSNRGIWCYKFPCQDFSYIPQILTCTFTSAQLKCIFCFLWDL